MQRQTFFIWAAIAVAGIAAGATTGWMAPECLVTSGLGQQLNDRIGCAFNWKVGVATAVAVWSGLVAIIALRMNDQDS